MVILRRWLWKSHVASGDKFEYKKKSWVIDSSFFYHMCPRKKYFETLGLKESGVIWNGKKKVGKVHDIGIVKLKIFDNLEFLLHNERYVPKLKIFLSITMFDELGNFSKIERGVLKILHDVLIMTIGSKCVSSIF